MRKDVYDYIVSKPKLIDFIRQQPVWYRKLTRDPNELEKFELASLQYFKQTIPDRVEQFSNSVQMANMMFHMFQAMKNQ
ncbi:YlbE-like family protein [Bacillus sp. CGMCC 1.16541]|uniref:YlbE-like family protein n=1 Tax=Bacillus sp. CGMCC 1.16541 TaxID=2185143 RepID=UPI000D73DCBF|nr:YlbE-like family protein [Bacillus sp. CGMCC 1.16541]